MTSDLEQSEIVLAGNSSVLVEAVTAGRPSAYVPGLDYGSEDLHQFVASGLIYSMAAEARGLTSMSESRVAEVSNALNFEEMLRFYQRPQWLSVLRQFANIDEDRTTVAARLGAAISELAATR